jgi:DNA (cytosine-5)-methyltransferase 1
MNYLSVCSGIEAATVAWHSLGWRPVAFSEIEKFPSKILAHHYPHVPNLGDMTNFKEWNIGAVDLLVGGTPCQSFSVAGLRKGLEDPRGNLMLTFLGIAQRFGPQWIIWENVPGVLSSNGGRDFGTFLSALGRLGYGFAYRVLDAQWFGVAQRRRRVFVVGYLGDWRRAAAVLFERESVRRNPAPSREKRKVTPTLSSSGTGVSRVGFNCEDEWFIETPVAGTLDTECGGNKLNHQTAQNGHIVAARMVAFGEYQIDDTASAMKARDYKDATDLVAQPVALQDTTPRNKAQNGRGWNSDGLAYTVDTHATQGVATYMQVRRLTPKECERLQGFPDNYTNIPNAADGPRYKALGNSMAVPVMHWIGKRIDQVLKNTQTRGSQ